MSKTPEDLAEEYAEAYIESDSYLCSKYSFLAGYKAAQEHAHAALEEAEARHEAYVLAAEENFKRLEAKLDQFADADKVMPDACEHILDMEKMVDVNPLNNSNGWISVKDRLPRALELVLYFHELHGPSIGYYDPACPKPGYQWVSEEWGDNKTGRITHWMPLPEPPKEEQ